ncbi:hypothetical protein AO268_11365 [Pseudomonas sp. ICMP 8385]|uniref:DUF6124 family protein n=1 Tax=Pseudomonas sp. ICMP 8385 TaxID=1718920 RepID=UPI000C06E286|nr:DUF3077 domain-containing protein [Pseudomonas sp. ICMP 8385]PHN53569.1 hypothetical protein AO268_11365 [Pseudomonas sp. ICMP 8385]
MNNDLPMKSTSSNIFNVRPGLSPEDALTNASELLASAVSMGYHGAFELVGAQRDKALGILQLVEMAQMLVDQTLEKQFPAA